MASAFGQSLSKRLKDKGLSVRAYAKLIGHPNAHSYVNKVIRGKKPFPLECYEAWMKPLGLTNEEQRTLRTMALLDHCPEEIQAQFQAMKAKIAKLEAQAKG